MRKILLIHQNRDYLAALSEYLKEYFEVQVAYQFEAGLAASINSNAEIILMEASKSNQTLDFIKSLRNEMLTRHRGIIVLDDEQDSFREESSLIQGADAYFSRNLRPASLVLRIGALLRRIDGFQMLQEASLQIDEIRIDPKAKQVYLREIVVTVTPTQYALLFAFACHPNQVLTRNWLQQNVWKGLRVSPRSIDAQVSKLKKLLPGLHDQLINVYGEGYLLMPSKKAA